MFRCNCSGTISLSVFTFFFSFAQAKTTIVTNGENTTITTDCTLMKDATNEALQITIQETGQAVSENVKDTDLSLDQKVLKVIVKSIDGEKTFHGFYESYNRGNIDFERIQYQPLDMLGVTESNIARVTFYYAQESANSNEFEFVFTSGYKEVPQNSQGRSFAGIYGSYYRENVLCPIEMMRKLP